MAKQFKLRISKVLPSFRSCRSSKDPVPPTATAIIDDFQACLSLPIPSPPPPTPPRVQLLQHHRNHVAVVSSSGCSCRSFSRPALRKSQSPANAASVELVDVSTAEVIPAYLWRKEDKWHVVVNPEQQTLRRKIDSDDGNDLFPPLPLPKPSYRKTKNEVRNKNTTKKEKTKKKTKNARSRARASTLSAESRLFSSDDDDKEYEEEYDFEEDEADTLICSSNNFSTDGEQIRDWSRRRRRISLETTGSSLGRLSISSLLLRRLKWMSTCRAVEGKVRESVAVVKRSEDPYEDFRRSMMEMVLVKQIYEAAELEHLLHCFLSLNSGDHHRTILRAFSEILDALSMSSGSPTVLPCK